MPPKRRRRFHGLYYHASPPKVISMNGASNGLERRRKREMDDFSVKLSTIRIWMHEKDIGKLTRLLWSGQGNRLRQQASTNPKVKRFLSAVPYVMNSIKDVHQAVIDNSLETLQAKLEPPTPPALVTCRDANGLNLIHKAAGLGHATILEYLIATWPDGVHETDITGKTPLHWAASAKNNSRCYTLLTQAGCDEEALDYKMKSPAFYRHKPHDIERAFLMYVPEAPRVSPGVSTDWNALCDDPGDGKKPDIRIKELNGFGRHSNAESNENTSEAELTEEGGASTQEEEDILHYNESNKLYNRITEETEEEQTKCKADEESKEEENQKSPRKVEKDEEKEGNAKDIAITESDEKEEAKEKAKDGSEEKEQEKKDANEMTNDENENVNASKTSVAENLDTVVNGTEQLNEIDEGDKYEEHIENDDDTKNLDEEEHLIVNDQEVKSKNTVKATTDDKICVNVDNNDSDCNNKEDNTEILDGKNDIDAVREQEMAIGKEKKAIKQFADNAEVLMNDKSVSDGSDVEGEDKGKLDEVDKRHSISSCNETYVIVKSEDENDREDENDNNIKKFNGKINDVPMAGIRNDENYNKTENDGSTSNNGDDTYRSNNKKSSEVCEQEQDEDLKHKEEEVLREYEELHNILKDIEDEEEAEEDVREEHANDKKNDEQLNSDAIKFIETKIGQVKDFAGELKDKVEGSIKKIVPSNINSEEKEKSTESECDDNNNNNNDNNDNDDNDDHNENCVISNQGGPHKMDVPEKSEKRMSDVNVQCDIKNLNDEDDLSRENGEKGTADKEEGEEEVDVHVKHENVLDRKNSQKSKTNSKSKRRDTEEHEDDSPSYKSHTSKHKHQYQHQRQGNSRTSSITDSSEDDLIQYGKL